MKQQQTAWPRFCQHRQQQQAEQEPVATTNGYRSIVKTGTSTLIGLCEMNVLVPILTTIITLFVLSYLEQITRVRRLDCSSKPARRAWMTTKRRRRINTIIDKRNKEDRDKYNMPSWLYDD